MATWMTLDGENCEDVGLYVMGYPPQASPRRRAHVKKIPGSESTRIYDGAWGYEEMTLTVTFYYDGKGDADQALAWFLPEVREIIFGDQPEYCYQGCVDEQVDFESIFRERRPCRFKVNFICSPFRHLSGPGEDITVSDVGVITHPGTARSLPLIRAWGSGEGSILFRTQEMLRIRDLEEGKPLVIDSAAMICTDEEGLKDMSYRMAGDYPYLDPGENAIVLSGGVTRIEIEPRFAWLGRKRQGGE